LLPSRFVMGQYLLRRTLVKHGDSVNALAFSYDGSFFASGADDGLVIIFEGKGSGRELRRFQVKAPVATLLWRSRFGYTLMAGDTSGDVHTICLSDSGPHGASASHWTFGSTY
jgi:WD40 repeat protein